MMITGCTNVNHDDIDCIHSDLPEDQWCEVCLANKPEPLLQCLDGPNGCRGKVERRMPLSGTGLAFPRCERHWNLRLGIESWDDE